MAQVWLLTLQVAMLAFVIATATAGIICLLRVILKKFARKEGGAK